MSVVKKGGCSEAAYKRRFKCLLKMIMKWSRGKEVLEEAMSTCEWTGQEKTRCGYQQGAGTQDGRQGLTK